MPSTLTQLALLNRLFADFRALLGRSLSSRSPHAAFAVLKVCVVIQAALTLGKQHMAPVLAFSLSSWQ